MDEVLLERIKAITPKFNKSVANGLAVEHMMSVHPETRVNSTMAYIDRLIHINEGLFPKGLVYEGSKICPPTKHFEEITREYSSQRLANIARSDTYLVKYQFSFNGEQLYPRYVLLPYVRDGGLITLNGALYNIAPVLVDIGFSVLRGTIYIPFRRQKLTFNKVDYSYFVNGERTIVYVIWSMIHNEMKRRVQRDADNRRLIHSTLAHYLFCRFGLTETFRKWAGAEVRVGWRRDFTDKDYPRSEWLVFESAYLKGKHPTGELALAVRKSEDSELVRALVGGFYYVVDTFPDRFREPEYVDELAHWRVILGHMVFGDYKHAGKVLEDIDTHLQTFENSLDEMTREELRDRQVYVDNIWELLYKILTDLSPLFYQTNADEASMYNKRLMVLRYVMEEFNNAISMLAYDFQNRPDKEWTVADLNDTLKNRFKLNTAIGQLTKTHGELNTVNYPGDNKMFRITSMLIPQDKARRTKGHSKGLISDASRLLHASIAEVGQFNNLPKNNPDGRARIGPNVSLEVDGTIRRRPERMELIDKTQKRLMR